MDRIQKLGVFTLTVAVGIGLGANAEAAIEVSDDFSNNGALVGSTPDVGGIWGAHSGAGNKPIQVSGEAAVLVQSSGSGEDVNSEFANGAIGAGDTIYAGFDVSVSGSGAIDDLYFAHFKDSGFSFNSRVWVTDHVGGDYTLALSGDSSISDGDGESVWASALSFDTVYRVIISYDFDSGEKSLWIDATSAGDTSITATDATFSDEMIAFALRQNTGGNTTQTIDNLIVADSFAAVVPEPASLALLALGGLAMGLRRRKA